MKSKFVVFVLDKNKEIEIQRVFNNYDEALHYANDCRNKTLTPQGIAKFTTLRVLI